MTEQSQEGSWLPNMVGGVSIWKLAPDLNEEQFFDGRLLVPETEGSDSLPARVEWDLTGLVPLPEARAEYPGRVEKATTEFFACLERTAAVFETGGSGYDKYKEAFTVPSISADGGAHYFFDPDEDTLKVINWGASPRKIKHDREYLFGYQDFGDLIRQEEEAAVERGSFPPERDDAPPRRIGGAAAAAMIVDPNAEGDHASAEGESDEEKKDEEPGDEDAGRPWWVWLLLVVGLCFLAWLAFVLLRDCRGETAAPPDGGAAAMDGGTEEEPLYGHSSDDAGEPATDMAEAGVADDGSVDPEAGIRGDEAGVDSDGGTGSGDDSGDGTGDDSGDGTGDGTGDDSGDDSGDGYGYVVPVDSYGRPIYGESSDGVGGWYYWDRSYGRPLPSRSYYHADAVQWRVTGGTLKVRDFSGSGRRFRVYLRPGENFDGVRVQWRDRGGNWHDH